MTQSNISSNELLLNFDRPNSIFRWKEIHTDEVLNIVNSLKNSHSKDFYDMSNCFLKQIIQPILIPLTTCINNILQLSIFPESLKISKVIPVYKKGKKEDPNNYRPISLVPVF